MTTDNQTVYNFMPLLLLMQHAKEHIKYPKITIQTSIGKLQLSTCGRNSYNAGGINVTDGKPYGENTWYGVIMPNVGMFRANNRLPPDTVAFVKATLNMLQTDPATVAGIHGKETGNCCFCQHELTNDGSIEVGYGPICAETYGLPHPYNASKRKPRDDNKSLRNENKFHSMLDQMQLNLKDS